MSELDRNRLVEIRSGTRVEIDLDRYTENLQSLAQQAGESRSLMAVVKANAYGHGAVACAAAAADAGCAYVAVARIDEALELRASGLTMPVIVIGPPNAAQIEVALAQEITLTVATAVSLDHVLTAARNCQRVANIHLKVDTGLHRYGALPDLAVQLAKRIEIAESASLEGIYTHFSSADEELVEPTLEQIERFQAVVTRLEGDGIHPRFVHCANSAAILTGHSPGTNLVRAGIATYGLDPSDEIPIPSAYSPILAMKSVLTRRFTLPAGESVSYNRTYAASVDEPAAAVPIGYADGIERHLSNRGWFIHADGRCPIIGRVCMDQTVVAPPAAASEGDEVTIIGDGTDGSMTVRIVGELCQTNTYEPVTRIAARVPRLYHRSGVPVSWAVPILGASGAF